MKQQNQLKEKFANAGKKRAENKSKCPVKNEKCINIKACKNVGFCIRCD
jgi:hypothetical protein